MVKTAEIHLNDSVTGREPGADGHKRQSSEKEDSRDFTKDNKRQESSYERSDGVVGARPRGSEQSLGIDIILDTEPGSQIKKSCHQSGRHERQQQFGKG